MTIHRAPLFAELIGAAYAQLPTAVRGFHGAVSPAGKAAFEGRAAVSGSRSLLARAIRRIVGLPSLGEHVSIRVYVEQVGAEERWTRQFGDDVFSSTVRFDVRNGLLTESVGPTALSFSLHASAMELHWQLERCRFFGIALPQVLCPRVLSVESQGEDGAYRFHVRIVAPLVGVLIEYEGWLRPAT